MNVPDVHEDLKVVLSEVRRSVPDDRYIWCVPADGFDTTVSSRKGILLGGSWSPLFLRGIPSFGMPYSELGWCNVPYTMFLSNPYVAAIEEEAPSCLQDWLAVMEDIAEAKGSVIVATQKAPSGTLLRTMLVNSLRGSLPSCAVCRSNVLPQGLLRSVGGLSKPDKGFPSSAVGLPKADEGWIRRTASVLFSASCEDWDSMTSEVAIVSVGGDSYDDQQDRLRFLMREIQLPSPKS
jgi:hypothetical protein